MKRLLVRGGVLLTALLCLGTAGYAGQVWWARRVAHTGFMMELNPWRAPQLPPGVCWQEVWLVHVLHSWREAPWYGQGCKGVWIPRRAYYELLRDDCGIDPGNTPSAWDAWLDAHPDRVWDENRKRLMERKP